MLKKTFGNPLIRLQSVDSTNNYAAQMLRLGPVEEGTVILAVHQTKGKGQGGNQWLSDAGKNLLFSLILKPALLPVHKQFYLSMSVTTSLVQFLALHKIEARVKWPNDIMINAKKLAGILIENTIMMNHLANTVIGVGLNVNQTLFPEDLPNPTSLKLETGNDFDLQQLLPEILSCLNIGINPLYEGNLQKVRSDYLNSLMRLNVWSEYADCSGKFEGRIIDVADSGELVMMKRSGETMEYGFREVRFL